MAVKSSEIIHENIEKDIGDNNAGLISAADVRNNMLDIVDSIVHIVASGDFDTQHPFRNNIKSARNFSDPNNITGGEIILESGLYFDNPIADSLGQNIQVIPYLGPEGIDHNDLDNLTTGNVHTQYIYKYGDSMAGNLGMGLGNSQEYWINSRGLADTARKFGLAFTDNSSETMVGTDNTTVLRETVHVGSGTKIEFDNDQSYITSGHSTAKAWIRFDSSTASSDIENLTINSAYNIERINRESAGKYTIYFKAGTFSDGNYTVFCHCNGTSTASSIDDMAIVTAASVVRTQQYLTICIQNLANQYVDAKVNDIVVFGATDGSNGQDVTEITISETT